MRRDDDGSPAGDAGENPSSRCGDPAGASPVSVSGNAPSSRLPARGEIPASEAERQEPGNRQKPLTGRQARGPQLEVKTAASSDPQPERTGWEPVGRAAHVTAKAIPPERDRQRAGGLGGVRVAARVQGSPRNTREPSAQPPSRPGASYKSKTKSNTAQRKSEGTIVPPAPATKAVQHNAAGGKGPWGTGRADQRGTRKGMDAKRPNSPRGRSPKDNVRRLQGRLRDVAKQQPGRKFHALYDRIYRSDVLCEAWNQVRRNQGAAGVDAQTIAAIEQDGVERFLEAIQAELREHEYQPQAVLRRYIPKADRKQRPLGIPTVVTPGLPAIAATCGASDDETRTVCPFCGATSDLIVCNYGRNSPRKHRPCYLQLHHFPSCSASTETPTASTSSWSACLPTSIARSSPLAPLVPDHDAVAPNRSQRMTSSAPSFACCRQRRPRYHRARSRRASALRP